MASILHLILGGRYDFLDYLIIPHARDSVHRLYTTLINRLETEPGLKLPELYYLDNLHTYFYSAGIYNSGRWLELKEQLEKWTGQEITRDKQAYDPMAMARSGMLMAISGSDEPGSMVPGAMADLMGGTFLGFAVMAGLLARERFGMGQEIDSSLFGPMLWAQYLNISGYLAGNPLMRKVPRTNTWNPMSNSYRCRDGRWLYLISRDWSELCRVLHLEELEKDPRFSEQKDRARNNRDLIKIMDEVFAGKDRDEWIEHFKAEQANLMYEVVNTVPDLAEDAQILANNLIAEENHRGLGSIKMLKFPFNFSQTPVATSRNAAPALGEHTDEVLAEYGYSEEEIEQLRKEKVI